MEQALFQSNKSTINTTQLVALVGASVLMILISIYLFSASLASPLVASYSGFDFSIVNATLISIFACISLPLAMVAVSQILMKWRGLHGAVWAFFWGSVITILAKAPSVFVLIGSAYTTSV